jgi:DNA-binding transcriptional ArsR family regulator
VAYRIHFTVEDMARTGVGHSPPLGELSAAVRVLRSNSYPVRLGAWRRDAFAKLDPKARMVFDLIPPRGVAPTFMTASGAGSPAEMLERMRATPRRQIREDLAHVAEWRSPPPWTRHLEDDPQLLRQLCDSVAHVMDVLLAPYWAHIASEVAADHGRQMRKLLTGGVESLLTALNPRHVAWKPPVLEVSLLAGIDGDLHLDGRGLLFTPSFFGGEAPAIDIDAEPRPVLRYPILPDRPSDTPPLFLSSTRPPSPVARSPLASLLGHTRAAVLDAIAEHTGCSTKELASLVGITPSSASEHATTLRTAGLVRTVRHRNMALHMPTTLGISLLNTTGRVSRP